MTEEPMQKNKCTEVKNTNKQLHASGEDYLEAILLIQKEKGEVRSVEVSRQLKVSKASVTHAVHVLIKGGFLEKDYEGFLRLTEIGREAAVRIYERHCFFRERLLEAGVDPNTAEQEACRMEHTISEESFQKLKAMMEK